MAARLCRAPLDMHCIHIADRGTGQRAARARRHLVELGERICGAGRGGLSGGRMDEPGLAHDALETGGLRLDVCGRGLKPMANSGACGGRVTAAGSYTAQPMSLEMSAFPAGTRIRVTQQLPAVRHVSTTTIEGTVLRYRQSETGSWFAHSQHDRLWLDRLEIQKDDGEITVLNLDQYTVIAPSDRV